MSVYATVSDLIAKYPQAAGDPAAQVHLDEAEARPVRLIPGLAAAIASGDIPAILVRKVLTDAVKRVLETPSGVQSQTVGPETVTYVSNRSVREVMFTDAELALLTPAAVGIVGDYAMGSARLGRASWCGPGRVLGSESLSRRSWC